MGQEVTATVFSLGFGYWLDRTGTGPGRGQGVLWTCAGLGLIPLALALALPEPRSGPEAEEFRWSALGVLIRPRSAPGERITAHRRKCIYGRKGLRRRNISSEYLRTLRRSLWARHKVRRASAAISDRLTAIRVFSRVRRWRLFTSIQKVSPE